MDSSSDPMHGEQPELNAFGKLVTKLLQYGNNASNNLQDTFSNLTTQQWLRMVAIVGGYMLLRPYLMQWGIKGAVKNLEENEAREKAAITPNELRGARQQLEEQEEEDMGDGTSTDWGTKARLRQRTVLKQMMEAEEKKRQEEDSDEDIQEFLED